MKRNICTVQSSVCVPRKRGTLTAIGCTAHRAMPRPRPLESRLQAEHFMKPNMCTVQSSVCVPRKRGTLTAIGCTAHRAMPRLRPLEYRL